MRTGEGGRHAALVRDPVEDGEQGQARDHAALLARACALRVWERGRDEVQGPVGVVAVVLLLQCDELIVLALLRLAKDRTSAFGNNEPLDALAALAVELVLETL